jgi:hypothetical protein
VLAAVTTSGLVARPAGADPTNAKKGEVLSLACEDLGTIEIATNGNGEWTPGHIIGSNQVLVPYAFHFEFTPPGGPTESEDISKKTPKNATLDICTFGGESPDGTFSGIAYVAVRP